VAIPWKREKQTRKERESTKNQVDRYLGVEGLVHGYLLVVGAEAVPVRVRVREEAALQHLVGRRLNS